MVVTCVHIFVKEEFIDAFIEACVENHNESIKESGNLRFDFLQLSEDPKQFMLYEAYESVESAAAHKDTSHYLKWRKSVEPMMAKNRQGVRYNILAPAKT